MIVNGHKLKAIRKAKRVSREELGVAAELTAVRIWQIEATTRANVNIHIADAMAYYLDVELERIK